MKRNKSIVFGGLIEVSIKKEGKTFATMRYMH